MKKTHIGSSFDSLLREYEVKGVTLMDRGGALRQTAETIMLPVDPTGVNS
jgi:hypothetical protein